MIRSSLVKKWLYGHFLPCVSPHQVISGPLTPGIHETQNKSAVFGELGGDIAWEDQDLDVSSR